MMQKQTGSSGTPSQDRIEMHPQSDGKTGGDECASLTGAESGVRFCSGKGLRNSLVIIILFSLFIWIGGCMMVSMPGKSYSGPPAVLDADGLALKERLEKDVRHLSETIGERNFLKFEGMEKAAEYIGKSFSEMGYEPVTQEYNPDPSVIRNYLVPGTRADRSFKNIIAEKKGSSRPGEIIVVGAHYDSVCADKCPGANDNASGVAAVLALAGYFSSKTPGRTIRFAAFANEEPPFFWTNSMGSYAYAKLCRERNENIVAMLTPETIGYYSDRKDSQEYPFPFSMFYPSTGNFIAFVGDLSSRSLVRECVSTFRENVKFPSEGAALPSLVEGAGWSDHWSFWENGYPALMITDTAPFRYPHYHSAEDTADKIDFAKMAVVVDGIRIVVEKLAD